MGIGDSIMALGDAWKTYQADPLKRKVAIGDGFNLNFPDIDLAYGLPYFAHHNDVAFGVDKVSWVHSYPSHRPYIDYQAIRNALTARGINVAKERKLVRSLGRYIFNMDYRPTPAPLVLRPEEEIVYHQWQAKKPFVLLEPYIKGGAPRSKQWPVERFNEVAKRLAHKVPVYQIGAPERPAIKGVPRLSTQTFRDVLPLLKAASLYIGPEGGLHHAAAAMGTRAIVIFGGYTSPLVTGYPDLHVNLTGGATAPCGTRFGMCPHCKTALDNISVEEVLMHAQQILRSP